MLTGRASIFILIGQPLTWLHWIGRRKGVGDGHGCRTFYKLRGVSCMPLELAEPTQKGIPSRAASEPVTDWTEMRKPSARYAIRVAEKMRRYERYS